MSPSPKKKRPSKPRRKKQAQPPTQYDGAVDIPPLPPLPFAKCPRCGAYVTVIVNLDLELTAHRTPMPESKVCEYPMRVHRKDVTFAPVKVAG